jgi:hypothetical protein
MYACRCTYSSKGSQIISYSPDASPSPVEDKEDVP